MARTTIYLPGWLREKAQRELPADESVSAIAAQAVMARLHELGTCAHEVLRCARCGQVHSSAGEAEGSP